LELETTFMAAAEIDVKYVAHLARIALAPDESESPGIVVFLHLFNLPSSCQNLRLQDFSNQPARDCASEVSRSKPPPFSACSACSAGIRFLA
jgi:hypothetical protein